MSKFLNWLIPDTALENWRVRFRITEAIPMMTSADCPRNTVYVLPSGGMIPGAKLVGFYGGGWQRWPA